jgi:hypothetical protein
MSGLGRVAKIRRGRLSRRQSVLRTTVGADSCTGITLEGSAPVSDLSEATETNQSGNVGGADSFVPTVILPTVSVADFAASAPSDAAADGHHATRLPALADLNGTLWERQRENA